ncbi:NADH oxidase [Pseudovibrio japonicus]|uniref:NADH oxidase n=1 Tax=Pseudovibrio japonicus TaxID=366534 RepID=A0ABQ3EPE4_9HYPH|nr:NADH:flavin oxidoreductase/NADH oxidase family protein [Pseudovibrio japonicus]GHB49932.1 NADH oxidase [Pseudovibrio japonicus]
MNDVSVASPFTLRNGEVLKNRFFKSAMSEQLADQVHNPTRSLLRLYEIWAKGGTGLIVTGNVMVDREQLGEPRNVVLDDASDLEMFRRWAQAASANGAQVWMQLNHPGKQVPNFIHKEPVAPSPIALEGGLEKNFNKPRALAEREIIEVIGKFVKAAVLAKKAGFNGVQLHGAHGYLISQFLSPRHNQRQDKWGGSLENRMRFVVSIYEAIRKELGPKFPIGIKLNSADFSKGGFSEEDSLRVVQKLGEIGIDLIEISGGTYEQTAMADGIEQKDSTIKREAYFLEYAENARKLTDVPLVVTGGFRSTKGMNAALVSGATDLIGVARPLAIEPDLPNKAISDEDYRVSLRELTTGFRKLDKMILLNMSWYEAQLARLGRGKRPDVNLSEWKAAFQVFWLLGVFAFKKRRA